MAWVALNEPCGRARRGPVTAPPRLPPRRSARPRNSPHTTSRANSTECCAKWRGSHKITLTAPRQHPGPPTGRRCPSGVPRGHNICTRRWSNNGRPQGRGCTPGALHLFTSADLGSIRPDRSGPPPAPPRLPPRHSGRPRNSPHTTSPAYAMAEFGSLRVGGSPQRRPRGGITH